MQPQQYTRMNGAMQIDVMFAEVDEVDVSDPELAFVFGRKSEPAQPQLPRVRAAAAKSETFVAVLASEEQVLLHALHDCC
jgi:hypothetical protein